MKRIVLHLFVFVCMVASIQATAQSPSGISFQGLALDSAGKVVSNKVISIRFSILNGSGVTEYQETQKPRTDKFGQFSVVIGKGAPVSGAMDLLNWPGQQYSLTTELDVKGGSDYKVVSSKLPFQSVPYAFFAVNAGRNGNTLTGFRALGDNQTGKSNTANGNKALEKLTEGSLNQAFGEYALHHNQTSNNNAFGASALFSNTTGSNNVAVGNVSLYHNKITNNNVAIGNTSLYRNIAHANTGLGFRTLANNITGQDNVAVGAQSLEGNSGGSGNTALGAYTNVTDSFLTNTTVIGFDARVSSSHTMVFGNAGVVKWAFGLPTTQHALQVGSNSGNGNGAYLTVGGTWTNASSKHFKEDFQEIDGEEMLAKISAMKISRWRYKGTGEYHVGPVAEEFKSLFNLGVPNDDQHISTLDASGVALKGIQVLTNKYESILSGFRETIQMQEQKIQDLEKRLQKMENILSKLAQKID